MNDYFCVFKRSNCADLSRRVVIESYGDVFSGQVKFSSDEIGAGDVQDVLQRLHSKRKTLERWCERKDLPRDTPFYNLVATLDDTCNLVRDEILDSQGILDEVAQFGMTAWIDSDTNDSYFEVKRSPGHSDAVLNDVELACCKVFLGTLKMHVIYLQNSFYITLSDISGAEQSLVEEEFPSIASKGAGFQIKVFPDGHEFQALALWQLLDPKELNMRDVLRERANGESKAREEKSVSLDEEIDEDDGEQISGFHDMTHVDEDYLWGRCKEAYGGSYTQTYLMLKPEDESQTRRALFRYGNWVYGGFIEMDQDVTLHDVPLVLRKFQRQQGKLSYWMEVSKLPDGLPFSAPMKHFAMGCAFIEQELNKAEETLSRVTEYHKRKGIPAWIDEENGTQFFELETCGDQPHYKDVELMASKTYFNGVVVITLFYQGSFYVTLSPSVDDQPLLDMSFPDVESKGRALQVSTYQHAEFKKLMIWQSNRSVWETANRAVIEQRRKAALQKKKAATDEQLQQRKETSKRVKSLEPNSESTESVNDNAGTEEKCARESKAQESLGAANIKKKCRAGNEESISPTAIDVADDVPQKLAKNNSALTRGSLEQKLSSPGAKAPHHVKPLPGLSSLGKNLPALDGDIFANEAPWDALGRPKTLFAGASNKK